MQFGWWTLVPSQPLGWITGLLESAEVLAGVKIVTSGSTEEPMSVQLKVMVATPIPK